MPELIWLGPIWNQAKFDLRLWNEHSTGGAARLSRVEPNVPVRGPNSLSIVTAVGIEAAKGARKKEVRKSSLYIAD